jgi:hypothetical protein
MIKKQQNEYYMMKYLKLCKERPEDLTLMYDPREKCIYFSGKKTKRDIKGKGLYRALIIKGVHIKILSFDHPQILIERSNLIELFLGGQSNNPHYFCEEYFLEDEYFNYSRILKLFKPQILNKSIKVL